MKKLILIIVLAMLCPLIMITAQSDKITIKGKIIDENALPVPGTTISVKGSNLKTSVNDDGFFVLRLVPKGSTLIVSRIGYQTKEIRYTDKSDLGDIKLIAANRQLDEVTIVSTGYQNIPKERATGSFTLITNQQINRSVSTNLMDRLIGISSGLLQNDGTGNNLGISIRGRSTIFANTQPLIVVDNFPYDGDINNINPNDIENVTLLKEIGRAHV